MQSIKKNYLIFTKEIIESNEKEKEWNIFTQAVTLPLFSELEKYSSFSLV